MIKEGDRVVLHTYTAFGGKFEGATGTVFRVLVDCLSVSWDHDKPHPEYTTMMTWRFRKDGAAEQAKDQVTYYAAITGEPK